MTPQPQKPREVTAEEFATKMKQAVTSGDPKYDVYRQATKQMLKETPGKITPQQWAQYMQGHVPGFNNLYSIKGLEPSDGAPKSANGKPESPPEPSGKAHFPSLSEVGTAIKNQLTGGSVLPGLAFLPSEVVQGVVKPAVEKGAAWAAQEIPKVAGAPKNVQEFSAGLGEGLADTGLSMTSPLNAAFLIGSILLPESKLANFPRAAKAINVLGKMIKTGFIGAQSYDFIQSFPEAADALQSGNYREVGKQAARALGDIALIAAATKGGKAGKPPVEAKPTVETPKGPEGPVGPPAPPPPEAKTESPKLSPAQTAWDKVANATEAEKQRLLDDALKKFEARQAKTPAAGKPLAKPPERVQETKPPAKPSPKSIPTPVSQETPAAGPQKPATASTAAPPPEPTPESIGRSQVSGVRREAMASQGKEPVLPVPSPEKMGVLENPPHKQNVVEMPKTGEPAGKPSLPPEPVVAKESPEDKIAANNKRIAELEAKLKAGEKPSPPPEVQRGTPKGREKDSGALANLPPESATAHPKTEGAQKGSSAPETSEQQELHQAVRSIFEKATEVNLEGIRLTAKDASGKTISALEYDSDQAPANVSKMLSRYGGKIKSIEVEPLGRNKAGIRKWTKFLNGTVIQNPPLTGHN